MLNVLFATSKQDNAAVLANDLLESFNHAEINATLLISVIELVVARVWPELAQI